ncbi:MAG: pyridoxamine 5'-phosphate oxidase family protein [Micropruina sp.]|nr:MAG: pyridoxamine 5'-phosphate oxidase family protein [Micropruina sp.]
MARYGHLSELDVEECRHLLRGRTVGRVGWTSSSGPQILPVTYTLAGDAIVFRVRPGSRLGELAEATEVSFQVDDLDDETRTGWSVLVTGRSGPWTGAVGEEPQPWAPGERPLVIGIEPDVITGRSVAAD